MKKIFITFIIILFFSLLNITKLISIENLGQIGECYLNGGFCRETKIIDNIAYVGCQYGLIILDISDSNNPIVVGSYRTPDICHSIEIKDDLAFLACMYEGLIIVDISNPTNPYYVSSFDLSIQALKIVIQENYAFISGTFNNPYLYILNIEDIYNPVVVAYDDSNYYRDFVVENDYIYAVNYEFYVIDISQISNPTLISSLDCCNWFPSIEIQNDKAFIEDDGALKIVNISDPNNLTLISVFEDFQTNPYDLVVDDDYVFITGTDEMGLAVININDPINPYLIQEINYEGICISKQNNNLYVSRIVDNYQTYNGIGIIDVEDLNNINVVGEFKTGKANKLCINNNYAYVANGFSGLKIIDISNPADPTSISDFTTDCRATDVIVESDIAYVAIADSCLQIIDVSNPSQPFLLGEVSFPVYFMQTALNIDKFEDLIYVGGNFMWYMVVINVTDPTNPVIVNQQSVNDFCYDVAIFENYLFLAGYWGGLQIFDLINPAYPVEVGYYPLDLALSVEANNEIAFIGDPYTSLRIFDTSNISNPILTETYSLGDVEDMFCSNDTLFVASSTGINLFNVSDPYNTFEIITLDGHYPKGVVCQNDYIFSTESFEFKVYGDTTLVFVDDFQIAEIHKAENLSNFPNPFNPSTEISFMLNENCIGELTIYNLKGQEIKNLFKNKVISKDELVITHWDGKDSNGNRVSSGIYFYKLNVNGKTEAIEKCLLLK